MYPLICDDFQMEQSDYSSVQPPQAPPPTPLFSMFEEPVATGVPVLHFPNQRRSPSPPPPPNINAAKKSLSPVPWSTGLCSCCGDLGSCCLTCWCPCIAFGRIAEIVDRGSTSCGVSGTLYSLMMCFMGCPCLYSCFYRSKLRGQFFLEERPCADCCVHCFCEECALCQEYRELKNQGFDLSIGWHGNIERQNRLAAAGAPAIEERMTR